MCVCVYVCMCVCACNLIWVVERIAHSRINSRCDASPSYDKIVLFKY